MIVQFLRPEEWNSISTGSYRLIFDAERPVDVDRIDYALLVTDSDDQMTGFATVRELDKESVYWQYGGAYPLARNKLAAVRTYEAMVDWTRERYKRITTLVENTNVPYLKLAMHVGFRIIGVRMFQGSILCELLLEFEEK